MPTADVILKNAGVITMNAGQLVAELLAIKGDKVLLVAGNEEVKKPLAEDIERQLHQMYLSGATAREAIVVVAGATGLSKKELYRAWLKLDRVWDREKDSCQNFGRSK